jgi:hypothetical protein
VTRRQSRRRGRRKKRNYWSEVVNDVNDVLGFLRGTILNFKVERLSPSGEIKLYLTAERPGFRWNINYKGVTTQNVTMLVLPNDQQCTASIQPVDAKGNPAQVQGPPAWSSSSEDVATVTAEADGLSATVEGVDIGTCQINVVADADLGDGVTNIAGVLDVTVTAGSAVSLSVTTGPLSPQAPAPAPAPTT